MTKTITRSEWKRLKPHGYALGDSRKGTAKILTSVKGVGTCLVPVTVVPDSKE